MVPVSIHSSQFPEASRRALIASLRTRRIQPKFHYDGTRQTLRWLALHEALSPSRSPTGGGLVYESAFDWLAQRALPAPVHVIGLGCGGGWKEAALLRCLQARGCACLYSPVDVSVPMVLVARQTALDAVPLCECHPLVADLAGAEDLPEWLDAVSPEGARIVTCFGLLPNFEPAVLGRLLRSLVRAGDRLALSANLAPGPDYRAGVETVLPQYDNAPTREWLLGWMLDLGFEPADGDLRFGIEADPGEPSLLRVTADFVLARAKTIRVEGETFAFVPGDALRVFFSNRYTPDRVQAFLVRHDLDLIESWIDPRGQEGVFVCGRKSGEIDGLGHPRH